MWGFEATYTNMATEKKRVAGIEFDGQFFNSEKECYLYAMARAFDGVREHESLDVLELVYC